MMMMNCFCGMVDWRKAFSLISSHCQRSSPSQISDMPWAGFVEWSCAVVITQKIRQLTLYSAFSYVQKIALSTEEWFESSLESDSGHLITVACPVSNQEIPVHTKQNAMDCTLHTQTFNWFSLLLLVSWHYEIVESCRKTRESNSGTSISLKSWKHNRKIQRANPILSQAKTIYYSRHYSLLNIQDNINSDYC